MVTRRGGMKEETDENRAEKRGKRRQLGPGKQSYGIKKRRKDPFLLSWFISPPLSHSLSSYLTMNPIVSFSLFSPLVFERFIWRENEMRWKMKEGMEDRKRERAHSVHETDCLDLWFSQGWRAKKGFFFREGERGEREGEREKKERSNNNNKFRDQRELRLFASSTLITLVPLI